MGNADELTDVVAEIAPSDLAGLFATTIAGALIGFLVAVAVLVGIRLQGKHSLMAKRVYQRIRLSTAVDFTIIGTFTGFALGGPEEVPDWYLGVRHGLLILLIIATGWLGYAALGLLKDAVVLTDPTSGRDARRFRTQAQVLRLVLQVVDVALTIILVLLTFPGARAPMASLLASAGVISVIVGIAAQSTMANMMAGVQLAFTDALRVGDTVRLAGETDPGTVEEITLNYVVVRTWDERRLLVPSSTFTDNTFENWTRRASKQLGYFEMQLDWTAPMAEIRAEVERLVFATSLWDKRNWTVQVMDLQGPYMTVRVVASAENYGKLLDLRSYLRENLVAWIRANAPWAIPRERVITSSEDERGLQWPTDEIREQYLANPTFTGPLGGGFMRQEQQKKILEDTGVDVEDPAAVKKATTEKQEVLSGGNVDQLLQRLPGTEDPYDHPVPKSLQQLEPGHMLFSGTPENEERAKMYKGPGDDVLADREARSEARRKVEQDKLPPELEAKRPSKAQPAPAQTPQPTESTKPTEPTESTKPTEPTEPTES